jgi:Cof subfamily protein (haloacid dehalogenase superfamily)
MAEKSLHNQSKISLVIADVDGTLVTPTKLLTERAKSAVRELKSAGIAFAITSSRPPRGMTMFVQPLTLETPLAGFNGGAFAKPDLTILEQHVLPPATAAEVLQLFLQRGLDVWLFSRNDWLVTDAHGPHVAQEITAVRFDPDVVPDFTSRLDNAAKIVGVSDDHALVARCEAEARASFSGRASTSRSQPYYLDITAVEANKGAVVDFLSRYSGVPREEIATIGDSQNDVPMFRRSGLSIAMGNASAEVKAEAGLTTASNDMDGFAQAMEKFILR